MPNDDLASLLELNRNYIRAAAEPDLAWYADNLADDYRATNPDGPSGFQDRRPDGTLGRGRYTGIYARRGGRWFCVCAHFVRN